MRELAKSYEGKGVRFFLVNSSGDDSAAAWKTWAAERQVGFPLVKDMGGKIAATLGATVTPEAVVVDPEGKVRYVGRLDDNMDAQKVTRRYAAEALDATIAGLPVKQPRVLAQGCLIFSENDIAPGQKSARVTYSKDIAPIFQKNCVACHRTGDVAPFPLTSYAETKSWAPIIKTYTAKRLMPPWKAVPGHGDFLDSRWLSDADLKKVAAWVDGGAPEGNRKDLPAPVKLTPAGSWALGAPDTVLAPKVAFALEADGRDVYRDFALPIDFDEDRYVSAIDFKPQNPSIVHHIIVYVDTDGSTVAQKEGKESRPGWSVSGGAAASETTNGRRAGRRG